MSRLAEIEGRLAEMAELREIVSAMRALAGMRMQEALRGLPAVRRYGATLADGLADALLLLGEAEEPLAAPARAGRRAVVLCMSEHGFVGGFNERLLEAAQDGLAPGDRLLVLGARGAALAAERGHAPDWSCGMSTRSAAAPATAQQVSTELYRRIAAGEVARVEVVHARRAEAGAERIARVVLLPLEPASAEPARGRQPPLANLPPAELHEALVAEYVFARLTEAVVESIAGENAARLAAMEAARENVSRKLEGLRQQARQVRQSEITMELLDLTAGALTLAR